MLQVPRGPKSHVGVVILVHVCRGPVTILTSTEIELHDVAVTQASLVISSPKQFSAERGPIISKLQGHNAFHVITTTELDFHQI